MSVAGTVLHLAPHPDDELIGAPATLFALRDAGWRVVNLACSLGSAGQRERRLHELRAACATAGFELALVPEPIGDPLGHQDLHVAQQRVEAAIEATVARYRPTLVVAPSPHDRHRGHEVVGRAVLAVCGAGTSPVGRAGDAPSRVWLWGLWGDLPFATLAVAFDEVRLGEILAALACHRGELERNDYRRVVRGRGEMLSSIGPERVFGFGSPGASAPFVEVVCELAPHGDRWHLGRPRWLDPADPLCDGDAGPAGYRGPDVTDWLAAPSLTTRYGPPPGTAG